MGWKRVLALALVVLFLGMTFSSAGATASFVNSTVNGTATVPPGFNPKKKPGDDVQPQFGGVTVVAEPFISAFVPGIGWIVAVGSIIALIAKYVYSKPVSEFTEAFVDEIPDKITYNGQELAKGVKTNIWGTRVEIGYGYVKKKWFGLKKEAVIVKPIITITRDEVKAVEDLFSPKEYGKLLAQAYLNGWDANDAKKLAEEFDKKYKNFNVKFRGRYACGSYFPEGDVIIDEEGAKHIIERHIKRGVYDGKSKFEQITAEQLLQMLEETIKTGRINCYRSNPPKEVVLEKYYPGMGAKNRLRVVIRKISNGLYKIVTAHPVDWD